MKKLFASILLSALLLGVFGIFAYASEPVQVTFWHCIVDKVSKSAIEEAVAKFNSTHKDIHVKVVLVPGHETEVTKLMTAVAAGTGPDVYYLDRFTVAQRAHFGVLEPLQDYLEELGVDIPALKAKFFDFTIKEATYKGKLYALPWDTDARVLYYNKTLFKKAGLDPNKPPTTIKELDEYAAKLTMIKGNRVLQIGFVPWRGQGWHYTWGWAFGGKFYDPATKKLVFADDPKILAALKWEVGYAKKYGIKNIDAFFSSYRGGSVPVDPFMISKEAMRVDGNWLISQLDAFAPKGFEYGIAPIPYPEGGEKNSTWAGGWSLVIPKGAKHPKEAAKFLVWMVTHGEEIYAEKTSHFAALKAATEALAKKDPRQKLFYDLFSGPNAHCRPVIPVGALLWDKLTEAWNDAIYGKKTPEQALRDAQNEVQQALDKAFKEEASK